MAKELFALGGSSQLRFIFIMSLLWGVAFLVRSASPLESKQNLHVRSLSQILDPLCLAKEMAPNRAPAVLRL